MDSQALKKLRIWCIVGLVLSVYATYVELKAEQDETYVALCDVNSQISCTAVFTSLYGRGFGIIQNIFGTTDNLIIPPNGVLGLAVYGFILITTFCKSTRIYQLWLILTVLANMLSLYLAYLLICVLRNICLICITIYGVNYQCLKYTLRIYGNVNESKLNTEIPIEENEDKKLKRK